MIGFSYNFVVSMYGDCVFVMDYFVLRVKIWEDKMLDFSDVYGVGVGFWDYLSVCYVYLEFVSVEDECEGLV